MKLNKITEVSSTRQAEYSERLQDLLCNDGKRIAKHLRRIQEKEDTAEFDRRIDYTSFDNLSLYNPIYSNLYKTKQKISSVTLEDSESRYSEKINKFTKNGSFQDFIYNELLEKTLLENGSVLYVKYENDYFDFSTISESSINYLELDKDKNVTEITFNTELGIVRYEEGKSIELKLVERTDIPSLVYAIETKPDQEIEFVTETYYNIEGLFYYVTVTSIPTNPFIFLGYKKEGDIWKSFIDNLIPYAVSYANLTSEKTLTNLRHGFPKTATVAPPCLAKCNGGYIGVNRNEKCKSCNGTGQAPISKSGYDVVLWSREALKNDITGTSDKLEDMYKEYPSSLDYLKWQSEELDKIKKDAYSSIFYSQSKEKGDNNFQASWRTVVMKKEAENEALVPFVNYLIRLSKKIIEVTSEIYGKKQFGQLKYYPRLVELSVSEILEIIKELKENNVSDSVLSYYQNKLTELTFGEDSKETVIAKVKSDLDPYKTISKEDLMVMINNNIASNKDLHLHYNIDKIISSIDSVLFFKGNEERIKVLVLAENDRLYEELNPEPLRANLDA